MSDGNRIRRVVIVGGGTAGWVTAACLVRVLQRTDCEVVLIESEEIGTIGVGEATIPSFVDFIQFLGIPEDEFVRQTKATFKLGIQFRNWRFVGHEYWHQFGTVGVDIDAKPFFQHWSKARLRGDAGEFTDYSPSIAMAKAERFFIPPAGSHTSISGSVYAWHFDAGLVAKMLSNYSIDRGVRRINATVNKVEQNADGQLSQLLLADGREVTGDLFVDCTGQRAVLLGDALGVPYVDWSRFLPVDRAIAVPTENEGPLHPYTQSIAHANGWRWRIPLQHRTGNGYVYCSNTLDDSAAEEQLMQQVAGASLQDLRLIRFRTGKRHVFWKRNCVAIGLSAGFLEPLESTSIYLIMRAALNLVQMWPNTNFDRPTIDEFNRLMDIEYKCIRDFILLHYCESERDDSEFWRHFQSVSKPKSLQQNIRSFESQGRLLRNDLDLFSHDSWIAVLQGMGVQPGDYDHTVDATDDEKAVAVLRNYRTLLDQSVQHLPSHQAYIDKVCALPNAVSSSNGELQ